MAPRKRFIDLPKWRRKKAMVAQRWKATQNYEAFGRFSTHVVMPGSKEWNSGMMMPGPHGHTEVQFASRAHAHKGWWYHASFLSFPHHAITFLSDLVNQRVNDRIEKSGLTLFQALGLNTWISTGEIVENLSFDELDGKSFYDLELEEWERIERCDYEHLQLGFDLSFDCKGAVDLIAVVPERHIDICATINIIDRFMGCGEVAVSFPTDIDLYEQEIKQFIDSTIAATKKFIV